MSGVLMEPLVGVPCFACFWFFLLRFFDKVAANRTTALCCEGVILCIALRTIAWCVVNAM
jgi:hypothetical protein